MQGKKTSSELNENYFKSLIATRASIGILIIGIAGFVIAGLDYFIHAGTVIYYGVTPPQDVISIIILSCLIFMAVSFLVTLIEPLRRFFYNHQRFSSIWQFLFVFLLYFTLVILCAILTLADEVSGKLDIYGSFFSQLFLAGGAGLYIACFLYNIHWLRKELAKGMSEERAQKNYLAKSAVTSPTSLMLIFGVTMIAPLLFKGTLMTGLGLTVFIILTGAFSRLHIEYAYAAVLKWQDKEYWEEYDGITITNKKFNSIIRFSIEFSIFIGVAYLRNDILTKDNPIMPFLRLFPFVMLCYWLIRIILWKIQKKKS